MQRGNGGAQDPLVFVQKQNKEIRALEKKVADIKEKYNLPLTENLEEMQRKLDKEYDELLEQGRDYKTPSRELHDQVRAKEKIVKDSKQAVESLKDQLKVANKSTHLVQAISLLQVMQATSGAINLERSALIPPAKFKSLDAELTTLLTQQRELIIALDEEKQSTFSFLSSEEEVSMQLDAVSQKVQDKSEEIERLTEENAQRKTSIKELEAHYEQLQADARKDIALESRVPVWENFADSKVQAGMIASLQDEINQNDKNNKIPKLRSELTTADANLDKAKTELHEARAKDARSDELLRKLPIVKKTWAVQDKLEDVQDALKEITPIQKQIAEMKSELDKHIKEHTAETHVEKTGFFARLTTAKNTVKATVSNIAKPNKTPSNKA
jgi:chromosome segregation ATPase